VHHRARKSFLPRKESFERPRGICSSLVSNVVSLQRNTVKPHLWLSTPKERVLHCAYLTPEFTETFKVYSEGK